MHAMWQGQNISMTDHLLPPEQQTPVPSPCIGICKMVPETGLCEGCMRTIDEIRAWRAADDDAKRAIWAEIRRREDQIAFD